jgi:transcriptional regulator with XRE-family HTH domain
MPIQLVTTFNQIVGRVIAYHRDKAGLQQKDLAEESGILQSIISRIERGHRKVDIRLLRTLSRQLKTTPLEIIHDVEGVEKRLLRLGITISESTCTLHEDELKKQVALVLNTKGKGKKKVHKL